MGNQINFVLREIDEKTADDPKRERTFYKFTPDTAEFENEIELKIKSAEALEKLGLPDGISDSILTEFGVKNKQTKI